MEAEISGAYFTVIQLSPNPAQRERVNVGVLAADSSQVRIRLLTNWRRAQRFSGGNLGGVMSVLDRLRSAIESDIGLTFDDIRKITQRDHGALEFTQWQASTEQVEALLKTVTGLYLVDRPHTLANLRGRAEVKNLVRARARDVLRGQVNPEEAEALLASSIRGQADEHAFDAVVGNGRKVGVLHGLSFEEGQDSVLMKEANALAFGIYDVRLKDSAIDAGVVALPPKKDETPGYARMLEAYERATRILESVSAAMLTESTMNDWLGQIAAAAVRGAGGGAHSTARPSASRR